MKRIAIAFVLLLGLTGCLSDGVVDETTSTVTVEPGTHEAVNVTVPANTSQPQLCYTADGDGAYDALVFGATAEYEAYVRGEPSSPMAALSSVSADKNDIDPDVDLGTGVEPGTYHVVIDNTDYDAIEPLESGTPSPASDTAVTVDVSITVGEKSCP